MTFGLGKRTNPVSKLEGFLEVLEPKNTFEPLNRFPLDTQPSREPDGPNPEVPTPSPAVNRAGRRCTFHRQVGT